MLGCSDTLGHGPGQDICFDNVKIVQVLERLFNVSVHDVPVLATGFRVPDDELAYVVGTDGLEILIELCGVALLLTLVLAVLLELFLLSNGQQGLQGPDQHGDMGMKPGVHSDARVQVRHYGRVECLARAGECTQGRSVALEVSQHHIQQLRR